MLQSHKIGKVFLLFIVVLGLFVDSEANADGEETINKTSNLIEFDGGKLILPKNLKLNKEKVWICINADAECYAFKHVEDEDNGYSSTKKQ